MKKVILFLLVLLSLKANACNSVEQAQKVALMNNSFLILYFSETSSRNVKQAKDFFWLNQEDAGLFDNYYEYTVYREESGKYLKKYQITELPTVLIVDGNGKEIYRYNDYANPTGMKEALKNFVIPKYFLINDLNNFNEKKTYESALRIAELYLDYSLKVDSKFRGNVYRISESYLQEAKNLMSSKDKVCLKKCQKLELVGMAHLAYQKNFDALNQKLADFDTQLLDESGSSLYHFLKYITAKATHAEDFPKIEQEATTSKELELFSKKADLILSAKDVAYN